MSFKKIFSMIMAIVLLLGIVLPCLPVKGAGETAHEHTFGQWSFDTEKGTQSRVCSSCNEKEVLHGTTNKVTQVTNPVVGGKYYLVANVGGELRTFTTGGVTETSPYSLKTVVLSESSKMVTLEDPTTAVEGKSTGFQLTFDNNGTLTRIYFLPSGSAVNTGTHGAAAYRGRHTVEVAEVNGISVVRKVAHGSNINNNYVLVVKKLAKSGTQEWRMQAVPESELQNADVYPVMLANLHTHTYGDTYESDNTSHWKTCDCGNISPKEDHNFVVDPALGYGVCACGANNAPHECESTDGKWHIEGNKHYQVCGKCGEKMGEAEHTFGNWIFDTAKGIQSKVCATCQAVGETLHGTDNKVMQVTAPVVGSTYYMVANVGGQILSILTNGGYTETSPYSIKTTTTLNTVTVNAALQAGKGEFQLVDATGKYIYSIAAGAGATTSSGYITIPERVSFSMDQVDGVPVIRAFGTNNILVAKYSTAKNTWRIWCLPESELQNEGVYPVMLATKHDHSFGENYAFNETQHWQICSCGSENQKEDHNFVVDPALGYGVCVCGANLAPHECESNDGKWYAENGKHYQLCGKCGEKIGEADHTYGNWTFDTEKHTQSKLCSVCQHVGETLIGKDNKVSQVTDPVIGESYYMAANVDGKIYYFRHGVATDTKPYSLWVTDNVNHNWVLPVTIEDSALATEGAAGIGFQLIYNRPDNDVLTRIYCYNAESSNPAMDTGINTVNYKNRHTFFMDEVGGVKVIRKIQNNSILAVKFNTTTGTFRLLGVPEAELSNAGVYPVMFANLHQHNFGVAFEKDENQHWHLCPECEGRAGVEDHTFVKNANGDRVCECGAVQAPHTCQSADNVWYAEGGKHYQVCGICQEKIGEADHTYGDWIFNTEKGTQSATCTVCNTMETLHGTTGVKGYQVIDPKIGESYYLAANVDGKLYFFRHGSVTDTTPYSLWVTDNINHNWALPVTVEDPNAMLESTGVGFQMTYVNPATNAEVRIYCYDVLRDSETVTGQTGVMDTGVSATANYRGRSTFEILEMNGEKVLYKSTKDQILVVKYDPAVEAYRMLGVPASELGNEGVYPAMLMTLHEHTHTNETYHSDETGHWFECSCGGRSNYEDHTVSKWTYTTEPTQTTGGRKTGTCTLCGAKAVKDVPAMVAEGHYYLTGKLDGKTYYFRDKTGDESVEHTVPFSLLTTDKKKNALKVDIAWDEKSNTYVLSYTVTRTLNVYMGDVNGSTIKKDGKVDLSSSATTDESLITFRWDPSKKMFYQLEGGVRYVIAFQKMTLNNGKGQAVRMLAVPESELGGDIAAMQLEVLHIHSISDKWQSDAVNHWQECSCSMRKNEGAHNVPEWKVEKKATTSAAGKKTGICTDCKQKVVNAIPMLTDKIKAPANGGTYYLTAVLNGERHYFTHAPLGGSVADTYPYSLYTDPGTGRVTPLNVKAKSGIYNMFYGTNNLHVYISGDGVGITSQSDRAELVDFQWDEENKVLYQMEGNVKTVLVFKMLKNNAGKNLVRITSMPLERALIDTTVAIARLSTEGPKVVNDVLTAPKDATVLKNAPIEQIPEEVPSQDPIYMGEGNNDGQDLTKLIIAIAIVAVAIPGVILLLALMKNSAFGLMFFRRWNLWSGLCMVAAGVVLAAAMILPSVMTPEVPSLEAFTIVANDSSMAEAEALAVEIYEDHGISLPVVHSKDFDGEYGIYMNVTGFNSYGGYKYSISSRDNGIYIDGTGPALEVAISKWTKSLKDPDRFPFGLKENQIGYEWNTGDVNMTGLGFSLKEMNNRQIYEGVELRELKYESFAYGKNTGYAVIVDSDAPVELKVSAGDWDENTTTDNPGTKYTVQQHGKRLTEAGYEVLAVTNAGFYDLNTTMTYIPWGMQIVDGLVKKAPNKDNPKNTDNWFAQTADGKFVISNTDGYYETYETTLSDGVGGGLILMEKGKPCFTSTTPDYRTVVGITKDGDLVILTIAGANYAVVTQAFMDMELDVETILNLDGGGSTTLHTLTEEGKLQQYICETPIEREVADAIAIVKKK